MMISLLEFVPAARKREAAFDILNSVEILTRLKAGCVSCSVYESRGADRTILYMELWQSREDFYTHVQSDLYFRVLAAMELSVKAPKLSLHEVSEPMGMELIKRLRSKKEDG